MSKKWNERDILRITRDCELGKEGSTLVVVRTDGPYMTARRYGFGDDGVFVHTGRDYEHAVKAGEIAVDLSDDAPPIDARLDNVAKLARDYFRAVDELEGLRDTGTLGAVKLMAGMKLRKAEALLREAAKIPGAD